MAIIERSRTRHIINLKDLLQRCNAMQLDRANASLNGDGTARKSSSEAFVGGHVAKLGHAPAATDAAAAKVGNSDPRAMSCVALSFDNVEDFQGMLAELQSVDVLVSSSRYTCMPLEALCVCCAHRDVGTLGEFKRPHRGIRCQQRHFHMRGRGWAKKYLQKTRFGMVSLKYRHKCCRWSCLGRSW